MYPSEKLACEPCKPQKPAPIFNIGDVVRVSHSGEIFTVGLVHSRYGHPGYAPYQHNDDQRLCLIRFFDGYSLEKVTLPKQKIVKKK